MVARGPWGTLLDKVTWLLWRRSVEAVLILYCVHDTAACSRVPLHGQSPGQGRQPVPGTGWQPVGSLDWPGIGPGGGEGSQLLSAECLLFIMALPWHWLGDGHQSLSPGPEASQGWERARSSRSSGKGDNSPNLYPGFGVSGSVLGTSFTS